MEKNDKFPRGHAYVRMRNRGYKIDIDWPAIDSPEAEEMIKAVCEILKQRSAQADEPTTHP